MKVHGLEPTLRGRSNSGGLPPGRVGQGISGNGVKALLHSVCDQIDAVHTQYDRLMTQVEHQPPEVHAHSPPPAKGS